MVESGQPNQKASARHPKPTALTHHKRPVLPKIIWPLLLGLIALVAVAGAYLALVPAGIGQLSSRPQPAASYTEAAQRVAALQALETTGYNPACRTQFMTHGQKVARAIVFIHGYTGCPDQFHALGEKFYALGYNVLIAPLPHHGLADRLTDEQGRLTAEELVAYADRVVDIGRGLGDQLTVAGHSGGAVTAAWVAQTRADVDQVVVISPAFGFQQIPAAATVGVMNAAMLLPDAFAWWDPVLQAKGSLPNAYPRYSRHALAQVLRLGFATRALAARAAPASPALAVVTNANDKSVDNAATGAVVAAWRAHGADVLTYEFPAALGLGHDQIGPDEPDQRVDAVYPKLIELINR